MTRFKVSTVQQVWLNIKCKCYRFVSSNVLSTAFIETNLRKQSRWLIRKNSSTAEKKATFFYVCCFLPGKHWAHNDRNAGRVRFTTTHLENDNCMGCFRKSGASLLVSNQDSLATLRERYIGSLNRFKFHLIVLTSLWPTSVKANGHFR